MNAIIFDWIGTLYERNKGLFPYTKKVLEYLKPKYKLGIVTFSKNGIYDREEQLKESGILDYVDIAIICTEKTNDIYFRCMHELKVTPKSTIIVDDRTKRGIAVGNKLGCETYWIQKDEYANELPNKETGEPTHKINSIEDLLNFL